MHRFSLSRLGRRRAAVRGSVLDVCRGPGPTRRRQVPGAAAPHRQRGRFHVSTRTDRHRRGRRRPAAAGAVVSALGSASVYAAVRSRRAVRAAQPAIRSLHGARAPARLCARARPRGPGGLGHARSVVDHAAEAGGVAGRSAAGAGGRRRSRGPASRSRTSRSRTTTITPKWRGACGTCRRSVLKEATDRVDVDGHVPQQPETHPRRAGMGRRGLSAPGVGPAARPRPERAVQPADVHVVRSSAGALFRLRPDAARRGVPVAGGAERGRRVAHARHDDAGRPVVVDRVRVVRPEDATRHTPTRRASRTPCSATWAATPKRSSRCATAAATSARSTRYDNWTVSPRLQLGYGARYADYDYLDDERLFSPRAEHRRAAGLHRSDLPAARQRQPHRDRAGRRGVRAAGRRRLAAAGAHVLVPSAIGRFLPQRVDHVEGWRRAGHSVTLIVSARAFQQETTDQVLGVFGSPLGAASSRHRSLSCGFGRRFRRDRAGASASESPVGACTRAPRWTISRPPRRGSAACSRRQRPCRCPMPSTGAPTACRASRPRSRASCPPKPGCSSSTG